MLLPLHLTGKAGTYYGIFGARKLSPKGLPRNYVE